MTILEEYKRDGYVVYRGAFNQELSFPKASLTSKYAEGETIYTDFLRMLARTISIQCIFMRERVLVGLCSVIDGFALFASPPVLHVMSPDLKISGGYYGTAPHQDWPSTQGSLDSVTVWVALTDARVGNFPLEVIPGSHKRGLLDGQMNGSVLEVEADDEEFAPVECDAGDVIIMSTFLVHRTGAGTGFRVAASQRFDNAREPTFVERGYPCAQRRVVDREIKWKPTVEQVNEIFS